jgi:hypothetical protein
MLGLAGVVVAATLTIAKHSGIWTSWGLVVAYLFAALSVVCLTGAIREWNFPFARRRPDTPLPTPPSAPPAKRVGIENLPGGKVRSRGAKFGPGLDEHIVNQGELDIEDHTHE